MIFKEEASTRKFRPDIQGLRAVAVIAVILSHFGLGLSGGFVGVDVFFVISGYLITLHLFSEAVKTNTVSLRKFYARRILRILPASILVLLLTFLASVIWLSPIRTLEYAKDAFYSAVSFVNYHFAKVGTDYFNSATIPSPFQHYWSLAVEEQFYFIWPLLVLILTKLFGKIKRNFQLIVSVVLLIIIGFSLYQAYITTEQSQPWAYFGLHTRAWQLAVGALAAVNVNILAKIPNITASTISWIGLGGIISSFFIINETTVYPGLWALIPTLSSFFAIIGGINLNKWSAEALLKNPILQWTGKISYSLYLVHWPLYVIPLYFLEDGFRIRYKIGLIILSFIIAHLSFVFIENKTRLSKSLKNSLIKTYILGLILILVSVGITGGFILYKEADSEERKIDSTEVFLEDKSELTKKIEEGIKLEKIPDEIYKSLDLVAKDRYDGCKTAIAVPAKVDEKNICKLGSTSSDKTIVLIGDSHAQQWLEPLATIATKNNYKLTTFIRSSCPVSNIKTYSSILKRDYTECYTWREEAFERIENIQPDIILYTSSLAYKNSTPESYKELITKFQSMSGRVIHLSDTPRAKESIPDCLVKNKNNVQNCSFTLEEGIYSIEQKEAEKEIAAKMNVQFIEITDLFCFEGACPPIIDNIVVYYDSNHMSKTYSVYLVDILEKKLNLIK